MKAAIALFSVLFLSLIGLVAWMFYMSEPTYIDHPKLPSEIAKYDIITMRPYGSMESDLFIGMVIQVDTTSFTNNHYAVVKSTQWMKSYRDVKIDTITPNYKIIGRGTFYHKANHFVGFNIMFITTLAIIIIAIVVLVFLVGMIDSFFDRRY
jgi:hypothetical protein